ncbi:meiosis expressed gene 1 protein homolog [Liolophura sinensis]|uniref:meiosis expressed gene 1 protein homolog n=1 Tax=Liolophura sinensis TaxID=3198878 RepID=UPI003158E938
MTTLVLQPKSMTRATEWSAQVEEAYRFQLAGYRDANEYGSFHGKNVDRWPHNGFVKKLQRKDGCFYYFNKERECPEKDIPKCKLYAY